MSFNFEINWRVKVKDLIDNLNNKEELFSVCVHAYFDYCLYFKNGKIDKYLSSDYLYGNTIENILEYKIKSYDIIVITNHFDIMLSLEIYT